MFKTYGLNTDHLYNRKQDSECCAECGEWYTRNYTKEKGFRDGKRWFCSPDCKWSKKLDEGYKND